MNGRECSLAHVGGISWSWETAEARPDVALSARDGGIFHAALPAQAGREGAPCPAPLGNLAPRPALGGGRGGVARGGSPRPALQPLLCSALLLPGLGAFKTGHPAPDLLTLTTSHVLHLTREHPNPRAGAELLPKHRLPSPT